MRKVRTHNRYPELACPEFISGACPEFISGSQHLSRRLHWERRRPACSIGQPRQAESISASPATANRQPVMLSLPALNLFQGLSIYPVVATIPHS
jgi:hypothetical protein